MEAQLSPKTDCPEPQEAARCRGLCPKKVMVVCSIRLVPCRICTGTMQRAAQKRLWLVQKEVVMLMCINHVQDKDMARRNKERDRAEATSCRRPLALRPASVLNNF